VLISITTAINERIRLRREIHMVIFNGLMRGPRIAGGEVGTVFRELYAGGGRVGEKERTDVWMDVATIAATFAVVDSRDVVLARILTFAV
jgi:hypothetical protein